MNTSPPVSSIPALDASQQLGQLPERLQTALDARDAELALREQLVQACLQTLRPELERLVREALARQLPPLGADPIAPSGLR